MAIPRITAYGEQNISRMAEESDAGHSRDTQAGKILRLLVRSALLISARFERWARVFSIFIRKELYMVIYTE